MAPWASRRRKELLELWDQLDPKIAELTRAVEQEADKRTEVVRLMTHPGVGPITGWPMRWSSGLPIGFLVAKKIGSYTGLIPSEDSSAGRQRLGHTQVSKAMRCCATCWEKQRKLPHGVTPTGDVGMCI